MSFMSEMHAAIQTARLQDAADLAGMPDPDHEYAPAYRATPPAGGYTVKGYDQGEFTELETFATLAEAKRYANDTHRVYGWSAAIVKHRGRTVYDTDDQW